MFRNQYALRLALLMLILSGAAALLQGCGQKDAVATNQVLEAAAPKQLEELNRTADELYKRTAAGQFEEARAVLEKLGNQVAASSFGGVTGVEGVNALSDAVVEAKRQLNAVQLDPKKSVRAAAALKLATDALTHKQQPMWLQYDNLLSQDTAQLEKAVNAGNKADVKTRFAGLKEHYDTIRPAVWISRTPQMGEMMDSLLKFFGKYTEPDSFQKDVLLTGIGQWKEALKSLFRNESDRTAYMPIVEPDRPVLWTATVGSLIAAVLAYAGWRMFKAERDTVRPPRFRP